MRSQDRLRRSFLVSRIVEDLKGIGVFERRVRVRSVENDYRLAAILLGATEGGVVNGSSTIGSVVVRYECLFHASGIDFDIFGPNQAGWFRIDRSLRLGIAHFAHVESLGVHLTTSDTWLHARTARTLGISIAIAISRCVSRRL